MFEAMEKLLLAGVGALSMTRERAEKIFDEYVRRGQAEKENRTGFVRDMMDAADHTRAELERIISEQVAKAVEASHLARREDLARLEAKIDLLRATAAGGVVPGAEI